MAFLIPDAGGVPLKKKAGSGLAPGNIPASAFNMPAPDVVPPYGGGGATGPQPAGPTPGTGGAGGGGGSAPTTTTTTRPGWDSDPILLKIRGLGKTKRTNLLTDLGDPDLASKVLGLPASDPIIQAIAANPYSSLARLARQHVQNVTGINEGMNKQNLFYGGHRLKGLAEEETGYGEAKYTARSGVREGLMGVDEYEMAGDSDAYGRWLEHPPAEVTTTTPGAPAPPAPPAPAPGAAVAPPAAPGLPSISVPVPPASAYPGVTVPPAVANNLINALASALQPPKGSKKPILME